MNTSQMPIIELSGTPRQRGRQQGQLLKSQIQAVVTAWLNDLGNFGRNSSTAKPIDNKVYLSNLLAETDYLSAIDRWAPDLLEEIKGIAEAAEQPFEYILGLNLMDEEWVYGLRQSLNKPTEKCTAFGVPAQAGNTGFAGQNMDISSWADGKQSLLRIKATKKTPEALVFSIAGCIGLNGVNAAGLGVTCNTLSQLQYAVDGLPVLFIVRTLLEQRSIDDAVNFLLSIKHASGQNYILSTKNEMRCFECCGNSVIAYRPEQFEGRVFHTNHPLASSDVTNNPELNRSSKSTVARLDSITERLGQPSQLLALDDIKAALSAKDDPENPVSCDNNPEGSSIGFTAGSSIYEFENPPRLHLAAGPPSISEYQIYEFTSYEQ